MIDPVSASTETLSLNDVMPEYKEASPMDKLEEALNNVSSSADSLGSEFIDKLSSFTNSITDSKNQLTDRFASQGVSDISPTDLISYQMDIYKISLQVDLASKCVSKNNQNCDTLLKAQ